MKAVAAADRGTGILVTCPVCLQAMCVYTGTRSNTPIAGFSFQKISSYCCFSAGWLALAREWEAAISILVGGSRAVALEG